MDLITIECWGKVVIWLWSRYIKKTPIPYDELELHYSEGIFILIGILLAGLILGITLLYFAVKK